MIPREALDLITVFEGFHQRLPDGRAAPYKDPVGIPTVGIGSIWRMDGTRVELSDPPITYDQATALLDREIRLKCEPAIFRLITAPLHPFMHGALVSWTYNLGTGALRASTLRRVINERRWRDVPRELAKWRFASGKELPGLVRRRVAEAALFMRGVDAEGMAGPMGGWVTTFQRAA